jgi:hypothetical protein
LSEGERITPLRVLLDNGRAYDRAGKGEFSLFSTKHCAICGLEADGAGSAWIIVTRATDGSAEYAIAHPADAFVEDGDGPKPRKNAYLKPVGATCLVRHPELAPFVLRRGVESEKRQDLNAELIHALDGLRWAFLKLYGCYPPPHGAGEKYFGAMQDADAALKKAGAL